jgi:penicillin amidase
MSLQPVPALQGWYQLNKAQNWDDFVDGMRMIEAPQLNISYADVDDNIGYWVTGRVPVRVKGNGSIPAPGWSGEFEWTGEVPFEEMPHAFNPEEGYVLSCNHKIVPEGYPHFLGNVWMNGYRARRLKNLIESRDRLSVQDCRDFQMDVKCLPGLELVSRLEGVSDSDADVRLALHMLRSWDGYLNPESTGGTVYQVVRYMLVRDLLDGGLGEELANKVMGAGVHPLLAKNQEFYGHDTSILLRMLDDPDSWWVSQTGGREALIQRGLKGAIGWLRETLGEDQKEWNWGRLHTLTLTHSLSLQKPFDQVFDRGPFPIGGDTDTPLQTAMMPNDPYENKAFAPSYRQIIDMGDLSNAQAIHPPGQSGHLGNQHYDDLFQPWLAGEYHPMLWLREQVEAAAEGRLVLKSKETD